MNRYIVQQPFRGVATFVVHAESGKEALEKVNNQTTWSEDVEAIDRDATWIGKAVCVRLEAKDVER